MNWRRVHEDDRDPIHWKQWRSGSYRIIWRDVVCEVNVLSAFQVCVLCGGWEFVDHKKPLFRTLNAAKIACEKHKDPSYRPPRKKRKKK